LTQFGESSRAVNGRDDQDVENDGVATDARPRRNPFLAALWVIGFSLIAGGLWLVWQSATNQNYSGYSGTGEVPIEMILQQLTWSLTPAMISTGFLVIVGLIFERAIRC